MSGPEHADSGRSAIVDEGVIHDLLNPLTAVLGNLDLLEEMLGESGAVPVRKRIAAGLASADELRGMMENLRFVMVSHSGAQPPPGSVPLKGLLERLRGWHESLVDGRGLDISNPAQDSTVLAGDEELLYRACQVLVRCAARIGTNVKVGVEPDTAGAVGVRFSHVGRAAPAGLGEHFFEFDLPRWQERLGTKIDRARGLWFVRRLVESYGGSIVYEPQGAGGSFILRLPTVAAGRGGQSPF